MKLRLINMKGKQYKDSILTEMRKSKMEWSKFRLSLATYSNLSIGSIHLLLECYLHGVFTQYLSKLIMTCIYGSSLTLLTLSKKKSFNTALFSFIHGEILIFYLLYNSFFSESNRGIPFAFLATLVLIFFQSYLFVNLKMIVVFSLKYTGELLLFAYFSGFFEQGLTATNIICLISTPVYLGLCMYFDYLQGVQVFNAKRQAETSMDKIEYIVGAIPDGIIVFDQSLKTVFTNAQMKEITNGADPTLYLSNLQYHSRIEKTTSKFILDDIHKAFNDNFGHELTLGITKKHEKLIEWKGKLIRWDSKPCIILYARDMTRIMILEKESKENKYKSMLLRTVSHELRTPTNAMLTVSELMKETEDLSKENQERVNIIFMSCSYLLCLINDLLDYSQMVAGCLKICVSQFSLEKLIEECIKLIKIQLHNRPIQLISQISSSVPALISTDPNRLKQILLNLLGNSLKFTLLGTIRLEVDFHEQTLNFSIHDTGIGIPSSKLSSLFQQFGKIENSFALNPQGAGLGLYISNMLTYRLGGNGIAVSSEEEIGSCFKFSIVLADPKTRLLSVRSSSVLREDSELVKDLDQVCILIVDDTHFNVMAIQQILDKEGLSSEYATSGEEAIEKVKKKDYDLILMDCEMPSLDGWQTTQKMKELTVKLPPILGNTSHSFEDIKELCLKVGMDDVIVKPCPREQFVSTIKKWISSGRKRAWSEL